METRLNALLDLRKRSWTAANLDANVDAKAKANANANANANPNANAKCECVMQSSCLSNGYLARYGCCANETKSRKAKSQKQNHH